MRPISVFLIVLFTLSVSFGFTPAPLPTAGKTNDFKFIQIAAVDINGDAALDANLTWHDIGAGPNNTRWQAKPDDWTWVQFQFYFHGLDGNDPNSGQCDVNVFGSNTYGGGLPLFHSTVLAGNGAMSHNPVLGTAYRTNLQPDPNYKLANTDGNFVDQTDFGVFRSGYSGTTSTGGVLRYTIIPLNKFYRVQINNVSPAAKVDYVYCVITGGK